MSWFLSNEFYYFQEALARGGRLSVTSGKSQTRRRRGCYHSAIVVRGILPRQRTENSLAATAYLLYVHEIFLICGTARSVQ